MLIQRILLKVYEDSKFEIPKTAMKGLNLDVKLYKKRTTSDPSKVKTSLK